MNQNPNSLDSQKTEGHEDEHKGTEEEDNQSTTRKQDHREDVEKRDEEVNSAIKKQQTSDTYVIETHNSNNKNQQQQREGIRDEGASEEDIQTNVRDISKSGDLSPRSIKELRKDKKKGKYITTNGSQIQTRSNSARPIVSK